MPSLFAKVKQITNLPTLPVVLGQLRRAIEDPGTNAHQIAAILRDDPAMMSRILKVANSAYYCPQNLKIDNLEQAVTRLGLRAISNLAMSTAVFSTFPVQKHQAAFSRQQFWLHCIGTGIAATLLRPNLPADKGIVLPSTDVLHLAGLLHDLGIIILEQFFHQEFMEAVTLARNEKLPLHLAERQLLGCDHGEVGLWLGEKWKLADNLLTAVRWHHEPAEVAREMQPLVFAVYWADWLCQENQIGDGGGGARLDETVVGALPLPEDRRQLLAAEVSRHTNATAALLGLGSAK